MTKEKYMALADFQSLWTNTLKPYIVAGFIAMLAGTDANAKNLVLADGTNIAQATFIAATEKGANSGVATLGADGKVPSSQLPSFVDDVIEAANFDALPETGEAGKIYITLDNNKTYRWGGTTYVEISASIALGETQGTAYEGSKGKANADAIAAHTGNSDIHVTTSDKSAWNAKYDKPSGGIPSTDMSQAVQDSLALADSAIQSHQDISGKADKDTDAVEGNFAAFDANGNPVDSGHKHSDYLTAHQDISGKADKDTDAVEGNFAAFDANGNPVDSGHKHSDYLTAHQDISGKQDKITATGILKGDGNGTVSAAVAGTDYQTPIVFNTAYNASTNKAATMSDLPEVPERVTAADLAGFVV